MATPTDKEMLAAVGREIARMDEADVLLSKLFLHHASQAKPHSTPCTKGYHRQLCEEIQLVLRKEV